MAFQMHNPTGAEFNTSSVRADVNPSPHRYKRRRSHFLGYVLHKLSTQYHRALTCKHRFAAVPIEETPSYRMSAIQNLQSFDPFADASKGDDWLPAGTEDSIHIRIQQRNGRKTLTTVQGISDDYDKKKLVKAFKKKFACNGTVVEHPEYGEVIQLQGDQRKNACQFLVEVGLAKDDQLKVHGF
ncbi:eukaryotic translation initiation factor 1-like [Pseudophryne corroboree]|uniref:eukaryotic translation initiation factor 1-like n=1 Tax=Pseudophryne corroboree TaxID=495146 RepID=UPI0030820F38